MVLWLSKEGVGGNCREKNHEFGLDRMIFRFFENWGGKKLQVVKHVQKCSVFVVIFRGGMIRIMRPFANAVNAWFVLARLMVYNSRTSQMEGMSSTLL